MAENRVQIVITTDPSGAVSGIRQVKNEAQTLGTAGANSFSQMLGALRSFLAALAVFASITASINQVVSASVIFNKALETSRLGIASLLSAQMEFTTAQGRALGGTEKLNAALSQSDKIIKQLQIDNLQTAATFEQLVRAYQQALAPGLEVGLTPDQIRKITVSMVQAGGAMGVPLDMMGEEMRGILRGTISARNTLIASALGITNEDIRRYQGDAQGLFDFLQKKLEAFKVAGDATQKTFAGLWSNVVDSFQIATGKGGEPFFNFLKTEMQNLISGMVELNKATGQLQVNPDLLKSFEGLFTIVQGISTALLVVGKVTTSIAGDIGKAVTWLKEQVEDAARTAARIDAVRLKPGVGDSYLDPAVETAMGIVTASKSDVTVGSLVQRRREIQSEINALNESLYATANAPFTTAFTRAIQDLDRWLNSGTLTSLERELRDLDNQLASMGRTANSIDPELVRLEAVTNSITMAANSAARSWDKLLESLKETAHIDFNKISGNISQQLEQAQMVNRLLGSGTPKEHLSAYVEALKERQKIDEAYNKAERAGASKQQLGMILAPLSEVDETLRLQIENAGMKKEQKAGRTPFGLEGIDQDYSRMVKQNEDMYRQVTDQAYSYYEKLAELSGNHEQAEQLRIERQIQNQKSGLDRMAEDAWRFFVELYQKLNKDGRGSTEDAQKQLGPAYQKVEEAWYWKRYAEGLLNQKHALESSDAAAAGRIKEAEQLAQVNVSYQQLTGSMEDQLRAQLKLIEAQKDVKLKEAGGEVTELGRAYKQLYDEMERIPKLRLDGSFADGLKEGLAQIRREMPTQFDQGISAMKETYKGFIHDLSNGWGDFVRKAWKGELKTAEDYFKAFLDVITDAFGNAVTKMVSKMMESQLTSLLTGGGSGGGGGLFGFLGSLFGGNTASSSAVWQSAGLQDYVFMPGLWHSGGIVGQTGGSYRLAPASAFAGAPRLHSGLAPDEFPAILQRGEAVIPRGKWSYADGRQPLQVEVKIDNQSSTPLKLEQGPVSQSLDRIVIGIVARDIEEYGVLGRMFHAQRRS